MKRHGHRKNGKFSPTYYSWRRMLDRCKDINHKSYYNYGGRGIKVTERWLTFCNFLEDMGVRPSGKTLDRINVNGDYKLENCRWATAKQQARNKRG